MNREDVLAAFDALVEARRESTAWNWSIAVRLVDVQRTIAADQMLEARALAATPGLAEETAAGLASLALSRELLLAKLDELAVEAWAAYSSSCEELLELSSWL